ncbi:hypothetical protein H4R33_006749 [Dimargaris cristalligena]|nr:hypothetical protein H4R33_006749 [Dimargaris cristalligena]
MSTEPKKLEQDFKATTALAKELESGLVLDTTNPDFAHRKAAYKAPTPKRTRDPALRQKREAYLEAQKERRNNFYEIARYLSGSQQPSDDDGETASDDEAHVSNKSAKGETPALEQQKVQEKRKAEDSSDDGNGVAEGKALLTTSFPESAKKIRAQGRFTNRQRAHKSIRKQLQFRTASFVKMHILADY